MEKRIFIEGMTCSHCVMSVKGELGAIAGVTEVDVNLDAGVAVAKSTSVISDQTYSDAIRKAGYTMTAVEEN